MKPLPSNKTHTLTLNSRIICPRIDVECEFYFLAAKLLQAAVNVSMQTGRVPSLVRSLKHPNAVILSCATRQRSLSPPFPPPCSFPRHAQRLQAEEQGDPHRDGAVRHRLLPVAGQWQRRRSVTRLFVTSNRASSSFTHP